MLYQLYTSIHTLLSTLPPNIKMAMEDALREIEKLTDQVILLPLFQRVTKQLEQTIISIHKEDFGGYE